MARVWYNPANGDEASADNQVYKAWLDAAAQVKKMLRPTGKRVTGKRSADRVAKSDADAAGAAAGAAAGGGGGSGSGSEEDASALKRPSL